MTKGTYQVTDDENPKKAQPEDTSFRSCICALIFVLVICIIILVATLIWSPRGSKKDTFHGENMALDQGQNTKDTTAKIIMQTEATTTEHYKNSSHGVLPTTTTTEKNQYNTSTVSSDTTTQNLKESSSEIISVKNENSSRHSNYSTTSETQTENSEVTKTKGNESTSTEAYYDTESSVSVSSKYQHTTLYPDETQTEFVEEKSTTEENISNSTETYYDTESTDSVSSKYQNTSEYDKTLETQTKNVEETTTEENESTSTEAYYDTESTDSASSKYQTTSEYEKTLETQTKNVEETTTEENESTSTEAYYDTESSDSASSKYQNTSEYDRTLETQTKNVEETTTEENESTSTEAYYVSKSSDSASSNYQHTTLHPDYDNTTIEENENDSTENFQTMTATSVPDVIFTRETQSVRSNESTRNTWTTDTSSYSTDVETTTVTSPEDEELSGDYTDFMIPNDSLGSSIFSFHPEPKPTTTQISVQEALSQQSDICPSAECKTVASRMLNLMNHSEDPCEDFYEFACGEMREHDSNRDTWDRLSKEINSIDDEDLPHFKTLKSFYTSCVEHEDIFNYTNRIIQVTELVKKVGWIIDSRADPSKVNLTALFAGLILRQSLPIFDVEVDLDRQTKKFILKLVPRPIHSMFAESGRWSALSESQIRSIIAERDALQSPKLDLNKIYLSYLDLQEDQELYLISVQSVVENLGLYSDTINWYNKTQLIYELRTSIEWKFLNFLKELPTPNNVRGTPLFKKPDQQYEVTTVKILQHKYPLLDWKMLFKIITGNKISYDTEIEIYFPDYLENIFKELQDKSSTTIEIHNALISMYAHSLYQNLVIPQARHHREDYCLKLSTKLFQDVFNNLYFRSWKNADIVNYQTSSLEIFNRLKYKLKAEVETQAKWLDESSKQSLLRKLDTIKLIVTEQQDRYNFGTYLESKYRTNVIENNWPANTVNMVARYRRMLYSIQGSDFSIENLWSFFINSFDNTPTSLYGLGLTVAPLGTMKKFLKNVPSYITMIRTGLPLAREIGHHFDDEGIVNGMYLNRKSRDYYNYMDNLMNNNTLNATMSVGNQEISFDVEPRLSSNERIADNTALRLLSGLYNEKDNPGLPWISESYPKQKLFYILVAQEYCSRISMPEFMQKLFESEILPSTLRVKNIVTNSEEFSRTFQCGPTPDEINGVSYKIQFPFLDNLDIQKFYNLLA